jgi:lipoyl(octanoyl) transferase
VKTETALQPQVIFSDLGRIPYKPAWDLQTRLHAESVEQKLVNRKLPEEQQVAPKNHLLFCEHNPVFTMGKSGNPDNLLVNPEFLKEQNIEFYPINRGGDITYHGPGQLTGYPIFDLAQFFTDIGKYLRYLEEAIIRVLAIYGLKGERLEGATGVWLDPHIPEKARKICAIGVHSSRWVTMHGFAFNVLTDLSPFSYIVPCGISDKAVTSLHLEIGDPPQMDLIKQQVSNELQGLFQYSFGSAQLPSFDQLPGSD